jgi:hypothetical protein
MKEGLLWFDDDPKRSLDEKIVRAATRFQARFGFRPTTCFVNPRDFEGKPAEIAGLQLKTAPNVRPNHFWLGVEGEMKLAKAA